MSSDRSAHGASRASSPPTRVIRAWRGLPQERRLAALAAVGLFLTLFLPWYQETVFASGVTTLRSASSSLTGWGAFSFVEAAVLLVAAAVLVLLFVRAEGQAFHVPGGDGGVIMASGFWTCMLIVWRIFDKQGASRHGQIAYTSGIEWGIFVALGVAAVLTYAGSQIRLAHEPEPPLPGDSGPSRPPRGGRRRGWLGRSAKPSRTRRSAPRPAPGPDMAAEDEWTQVMPDRRQPSDASEAPTRRARPRSIGDPATPHDAPTPREPPAVPDPTGPVSARRTRPLDRREIQELDIAEPPTSRLRRSAPAEPPTSRLRRSAPAEPPTTREGSAPDDPPTERLPPESTAGARPRQPRDPSDDELTIRLDRPD